MKQTLKVVGAAIVKDGKLLALRRSDGIDSVIHKFEFVGGKVEAGETHAQALMRECMEELSLQVEVGELVGSVTYEYHEYTIELCVYLCKMLSSYVLKEHEEERWLDCKTLSPEEWAPADGKILCTLKNGLLDFVAAQTDGQLDEIVELANEIMHQTFDATMPKGQADYMINLFLSPAAIRENVKNHGYEYKLVKLNGETVGYYAHCPAQNYDSAYKSGTFLSKLYLKERARGFGIAGKVINSLPRPIVLTVKKDNLRAVQIYKHIGFKIIDSVVNDIGGGYVMDDFIMQLD